MIVSPEPTSHHPRLNRLTRGRLVCLTSTLALTLAVALVGCAGNNPREDLPFQALPAFAATGQAVPHDRWWTAFDDDQLTNRIDLALAGNFTLEAAWERLREANALLRTRAADLRPALDATAEAALENGSDVDDRTRLGVGLQASYEVDLWGRIRATVDAEQLRATATDFDYRAAAISLSAEVSLTWYQLAEARLQLALIESQIRTNETVLEVIEIRFSSGQSGSADVLRQRQLVEATREQAVQIAARIEVLEHQLAVLEGRPPQHDIDYPPARLPALPATPATGVPSEVLQRRPDVQAVMLRIDASDRDVAAAVRDQYPRLNIAAAVSSAAENPSQLLNSWLASLGAQLVAPLYDGDRRRAEVDRRVAIRRGLIAQYGQAVLNALAEVEDALALERRQTERIARLETRLDLARRTYAQLRTEYLNGATDFIDILTALEDQQQIERDLLSAGLGRLEFRIALHRAIAGGFVTRQEAD